MSSLAIASYAFDVLKCTLRSQLSFVLRVIPEQLHLLSPQESIQDASGGMEILEAMWLKARPQRSHALPSIHSL